MVSTSALPEPRKSSAASEPRDPLALARTLSYQFALLSGELQARGGIRDRVYGILKDAYWLGSFFKECPDEYRRFKGDAYWLDVRQKPNDRNVMRSVLSFVMRANQQESLQNRACKYARVLECLHQQELLPDEVPQRLKDGGGIDAIYATLCRDARPPEGRWELPLSRTANGTGAVQGPLAEGEVGGDRDDGGLADEGQLRSVPLLTVANDSTDTLRGEIRPAGASKRGQLHGFPHKIILEVEMFEFELEEVLGAKRATICVNVEPKGNRRRRPVVAQFVFTSNRTDGPWPGRSTNNRDDDERR
jgi:hypothetical protein